MPPRNNLEQTYNGEGEPDDEHGGLSAHRFSDILEELEANVSHLARQYKCEGPD